MEQQTWTNRRPKLRMARFGPARESVLRRMVREGLERANITAVSARHVEAVLRDDLGAAAETLVPWMLDQLLPRTARRVEADRPGAEKLAVQFGLN